MAGVAPHPVALYVHLLGTALFCFVFLYLRRQSGIVYFGYWGLAWALETVAVIWRALTRACATAPSIVSTA